MKPGETLRFDCNVCRAEFCVIYEPDEIDKGLDDPDKDVDFCPFCGEENVSEA